MKITLTLDVEFDASTETVGEVVQQLTSAFNEGARQGIAEALGEIRRGRRDASAGSQ